jgi:hypothetical protein
MKYPWIFLICLWPVVFLAVWAVWNVARNGREERKSLRAVDWPKVRGTVVESRGAWAHVEVVYEYVADGKTWRGVYKMNLTPVVPDRSAQGAASLNRQSREDIEQYPAGSHVLVQYDPKKPADSILYCSDEPVKTGSTPAFQSLDLYASQYGQYRTRRGSNLDA